MPALLRRTGAKGSAMERFELLIIRAGDDLLIFEESDSQFGPDCVAVAANGKRCRESILDGAYLGRTECYIAGTDGYVDIFQEGWANDHQPQARTRRQRCSLHAMSDSPDAVPPSWELFSPVTHKHLIKRSWPLWTTDGFVPDEWGDEPVLLPAAPPASPVDPGDSIETLIPYTEPPAADHAPVPTALYRYYDAEDLPLYIGISGRLRERERSHIKSSSWMDFVARSTVERFPSREEADLAERAAIKEELPLFNTTYNESRAAINRLVEYLIKHGRTDLLSPAVSRG